MRGGKWGAFVVIVGVVMLASCTPASVPESPDTTTVSVESTGTNTASTATTSRSTIAQPPTTTFHTATSTTEPVSTTSQTRSGEVEIVQERFYLGGEVTNPGSPAEGLLMNSRMVQAVIDIDGDSGLFVYPDTGAWDPERNATELIAALPIYASHGLNAITVNLQGGNPLDAPAQDRPPWTISAYQPDGSLEPSWMDRLDRLLRSADAEGMAVIVGLFYFGQDHLLEDATAVTRAVDNVVDWLMARDHRNVLIEICNESSRHYDHEILRPPRVNEMMERVTTRSGGSIPVSVSLPGGHMPDARIIEASSYVLLHGNRQEARRLAAMVRDLRSLPAFMGHPKPIVFNEDSTRMDNLLAAVNEGAGWGYHDKGANDYHNGFQAPPVDWSVGTDDKRTFFDEIARLTGR